MGTRLVVTAAATVFGLVACGGSSPTPAGGARTQAPAGAATPTSAAPAAATPTTAPAGGSTTAPAGGSTTAPAGGPAAIAAHLCGLLTTADLKAALGAGDYGDYGAGVPDTYGECTWRVGSAAANDGKGQLVAAFTPATLDYVKSSFSGGTNLTVGADAAYWNGTQGLQSLWVDVGGGQLLTLSFDPITNDTQAAAQQLAGVMIGKM